MRDFSVLHGRLGGWLSVAAMGLLMAVVTLVYMDRVADEPACGPEAAGSVEPCGLPFRGATETLSGDSSFDPTGATSDGGDAVSGGAGSDPAGADGADGPRLGREVPFVSLQPSPEPMTDAGRQLVRQNETGG